MKLNTPIKTEDQMQKPIRLMQKEIKDLKNNQTMKICKELNKLKPPFIKEIASTPMTKKIRMP